jgi:hypothetical protein
VLRVNAGELKVFIILEKFLKMFCFGITARYDQVQNLESMAQ